MKPVHGDPYSAHQEVFLLLPWYVNKTLHDLELKQVDAHLNVCLTCRREIASLQKLARMVNQSSSLDSAEQASFAQLRKRLHHQPSTPNQKLPTQVEPIKARSNRTKRLALTQSPLSRLALAAVLVLSLMIPEFMGIDQLLSHDYRTLSAAAKITANNNEMHIVFADNTTPQQINRMLAQISGQIVGGQPTDQSVYTVRSPQATSKEEIQRLLAQLRKNPQVFFAEPAYTNLAITPSQDMQKMNRIFPILLMGMILGTVSLPSHSEPLDLGTPELSGLFKKENADHIVLVAFTDQSINAIPDLASGNAYRKRGQYGSSTWSQRITDQIAEDHLLKKLTEWPMTEAGMHCAVYQVPATASVTDTLKELSRDARVEIVQQMHFFKTQTHRYNDPYFKLQANMQQMQIDQAHSRTTGRHVTIAMIDTGVALDHPDLMGQITQNENFAIGISASFSNDKHGTAVAGIMVAKKDNGTGITGVAPDAKLIALKACWPDQADAMAAVCNSLTLALAVNAAIKADVDILNMSLTGPDDPLLAVLLKRAIDKGILVVAANTGSTNENEGFPASLPNVIAVQSQQEGNTPVNVVTAPGEKVLTTLPQGTYDFISGSSIATAEVSGVIALLLELKPDLDLAETKTILQKSELSVKKNYYSVINAGAAVLALCETINCPTEILSQNTLQRDVIKPTF